MAPSFRTRRELKVNRLVGAKLPEDLRLRVQAYIDGSAGTYSSVAEALKDLLVRGLFITEKPAGKMSEAAYHSAFISAKGEFLDRFFRKLGSKLAGVANEVYEEMSREKGHTPV
ncbi:MAG: hypothetical protein M0R22_00025 [Dehalococcoidia bacterium]|jgi:hypothetical protein|nr:hypothetical protein [Dehalococcoidia bacterium]